MFTWDDTLLTWLNHLVALNPQTFVVSLFLSNRVPYILSALTLVALWFQGEESLAAQRPGQLTRQESRCRVILIFVSAVLAFILARFADNLIFRPRPLVDFPLQVPLDPQAWSEIVAAFKSDNAFPSDNAAFWFALAAGLFSYNRRAGWGAVLAGLLFSLLRVGLGYSYPTDIIAGACLGILTWVGVFSIGDRLTWITHFTLQFFEKAPMLAYPLGLGLLLDITQQLRWIFAGLTILFGIRLG